MTPLIKYFLVLLMLAIQLIPIAIGGYLFSLVSGSGLFMTAEIWGMGLIFALLALWSIWLVTHSIFALFICTLPDTSPLQALRSAKKMVYRRRLAIWRKLMLGIVLALVVCAIFILPALFLFSSLVPWLVFVLSVVFLPIMQAFLYTLYREIL